MQVIGNVLAILETAGAASGQLARVIAYIVSIEHWQRFDAIFAETLGAARAGAELQHGFLVEINAIALVGRPA
jgi:enamine deaminase RidA (YjgF/YER057c/UK114 family)